jgi:hypothetical protein
LTIESPHKLFIYKNEVALTPNVIRYSGNGLSGLLKKGNYYLGIDDTVNYGPTETTDFWNGYTPPTNGYTVYLNKTSQGPSIYAASNSSELIVFAKEVGGTNINSEQDALDYFNGRSDVVCVNVNYPNIVTNGLSLFLDSGFIPSYKKSGNTWTDLSFSGKNATLINSPSFIDSTQGLLLFEANSNQYATTEDLGTLSNFTVNCWFYLNTLPQSNKYPTLVCNTYDLVSKLNFSLGVNEIPWTGRIAGGFFNSSWYNASGFTPTVNTWTNACVSYDGSNIKLYKDGELFSSASTSTAAITSGQGVRIARRWDDNDYIDGYIPIVSVYNRALTSEEIYQNYSVIFPRFQVPTPTPSITPTQTPTNTITPSITSSITPTQTPTNTITPSITSSITPTQTPTNTITPSITPSITPTKTPTNTITPSITSSITPTKTPTNTITPSITPTQTPTNTITPTNTPTPTRTAYTYYRWQITNSKTYPPNANCVQSSEFVFQVGGVDQSMTGVTVTNPSGNNPIGEGPSNLVDGLLTTKALDLNFVSNGNVTNFIFQFSSSKSFTGYRWATANDEESRDPKSWTIAGSNNGSTWTTLHTVTNFSATAGRQTYQTAQTY